MSRNNPGGGLSLRAKAALVFASVMAAAAVSTAPSPQRNQSTGSTPPPSPSVSAQSQNDRSQPLQQAPSSGGQSGAVANIGGGLDTVHTFRARGLTPKDWGMSRACQQMVRKNRLLAMGLSSARI